MSAERNPRLDTALGHIRQCMHIGLQGAELIGEAGRQRIDDWADFIDREIREAASDPGAPRPPAQASVSGPGTPDRSTARGTGVSGPEISAQAVEGHWLKFNKTTREVIGCQCGFAADIDSDCGWGDSVVRHFFDVGAAAARPVHYRESAASVRKIAAVSRAEVGSNVTISHEFLDGITYAATLLDSAARDLEDEAPWPS